ncbi:MAG: hypothetical protein WAT39_13575 [Planctomycetota bacterium]
MAVTAALLLSTLLPGAPQDPPAPAATSSPHVEWQRTLADALAVQQATGLPLLIAVNMDGEVFNERFARQTYRDPTFIESTRGYVCVVASPDRHNENDYDALGNRIECPRFPGCTCAEHIAIEPEVFRRWFNGTRNAPRHVGVSPAGKVLFDRFLDQSMATAIDAIDACRGKPKPGVLAPTDDLAELFRRRDAASRRHLERMWRAGTFAVQKQLLEAAAHATNEPVDLLRVALRSDDPALAGLATLATSKHAGKETVIDLEDALARVDDPTIRQDVVARLAQLGKTDNAAARLAEHLAATATAVVKPWSNPWAPARFDGSDRAAVEAELDRAEAALRSDANDSAARLQLAVAQLALADLLIRDGGKGVELWFSDAISNARKVSDPALAAEVQAVVGYAAYLSADFATASKAIALAQTLVNSPRSPDPHLAARFLELDLLTLPNAAYADPAAARERSQRAEIERALGTMDLLLARGAASEKALLAGIGLLEFGGLRLAARTRLVAALALFPASAPLHERWRNRLVADLGTEAMRKAYAGHVDGAADKPTAEWFAGYAALVAGEQHTRDKRADVAMSAYAEAIERLARSVAGNADFADSANHFAVLALAGRAELLLAKGDLEAAAADLLRGSALRPESLDSSDGLERKPRAIAGRVVLALEKAGKTELAAKLKPILP